jgi:hypothetical protein
LRRWRPSVQGIVTLVVVVSCGALVGYPIVYLVAWAVGLRQDDDPARDRRARNPVGRLDPYPLSFAAEHCVLLEG